MPIILGVGFAQVDNVVYDGIFRIFPDDDHAPADFIAGYMKEILNVDFSKEIKDCWVPQNGLKAAMDQAWVGLENPDTKKETYLEMRSKTFYPIVA